jgi:predicted Fe-S protein YdhL (DUF1289 family)
MSPALSTTCIRVCVLDPDLGLCLGCGRTLDEIAQWGRLTESERLAIIAGLDARLRQANAAVQEEKR